MSLAMVSRWTLLSVILMNTLNEFQGIIITLAYCLQMSGKEEVSVLTVDAAVGLDNIYPALNQCFAIIICG